ncbi:M20/M25/M40 family metallo-hydrolase [Echinicola jeungdonensis]|uniref:M20/M25/M40 family metallo-hydrolase n=1 Tax=Echinicola jeungdonensis TaxID=709343 RepID=A0ABV5J3F8_9BACT|nr:M20/M25/M40 family metallo-hydrolase [Echinicola jeungdonensis]MDN3668555.1 M20/M25/M40 family metallo-hydrolase [Echinicola jeungdonensis]
MELLKEILNIRGVSGDEHEISSFIINYVLQRRNQWKVVPEVFYGDRFQDNVVLKFGDPRTAVFAHIDTIGFTSRYENQLVPVGGPDVNDGDELEGEDLLGPIACKIKIQDEKVFHDFPRGILPGTNLSFRQNLRIGEEFIQGAYLDNRLGVYNALKLCEDLTDGVVVFSTYEEHGGGSVPFLLKFIYEQWEIRQALVSDITWVTDGVIHGNGTAISLRDKFIPRKVFLNKIVSLAEKSGIPYQIEVEGAGGSDGREIQMSPYPVDWCFIGAPEDHVHTPNEKVALKDLESMLALYRYLMVHL